MLIVIKIRQEQGVYSLRAIRNSVSDGKDVV